MRKLTTILMGGMLLILVACGNGAAPTTPSVVNVEASDFRFEPATIELKAGQPVKLSFRNKGAVEHDFSVMAIQVANSGTPGHSGAGHDMSNMAMQPDLHTIAAAGQTSTLEFTPSQSGTYEFQCTVAGHKDAGMTGRLVVN